MSGSYTLCCFTGIVDMLSASNFRVKLKCVFTLKMKMKAACSSKTLAKRHFSVQPSCQKRINISLLILYYHIYLGCGSINLLCKLAKNRKLQKKCYTLMLEPLGCGLEDTELYSKDRQEICFFSRMSRLALWLTQLPTEGVQWAFSPG